MWGWDQKYRQAVRHRGFRSCGGRRGRSVALRQYTAYITHHIASRAILIEKKVERLSSSTYSTRMYSKSVEQKGKPW